MNWNGLPFVHGSRRMQISPKDEKNSAELLSLPSLLQAPVSSGSWNWDGWRGLMVGVKEARVFVLQVLSAVLKVVEAETQELSSHTCHLGMCGHLQSDLQVRKKKMKHHKGSQLHTKSHKTKF